jgi:hypothetical protein
VGQKSHEKIDLKFKEFSSLPTSNNTENPKEKEEYTQNSNVMNQKNISAHKK